MSRGSRNSLSNSNSIAALSILNDHVSKIQLVLLFLLEGSVVCGVSHQSFPFSFSLIEDLLESSVLCSSRRLKVSFSVVVLVLPIFCVHFDAAFAVGWVFFRSFG